MTRNQLEYRAQNEAKRANLTREQETQRANMAGEEIQRTKGLRDYMVSLSNLREAERSNRAREAENLRSNLAREAETHRYNVEYLGESKRHSLATENIARMNVALGYSQLAEQSRHNVQQEVELKRSNIAKEAETHRANLRGEELLEARQAESKRHNVAEESLTTTKMANEFTLGTKRLESDIVLGGAEVQAKQDMAMARFVSDSLGTFLKYIS